jgi:hypothetical protein
VFSNDQSLWRSRQLNMADFSGVPSSFRLSRSKSAGLRGEESLMRESVAWVLWLERILTKAHEARVLAHFASQRRDLHQQAVARAVVRESESFWRMSSISNALASMPRNWLGVPAQSEQEGLRARHEEEAPCLPARLPMRLEPGGRML